MGKSSKELANRAKKYLEEAEHYGKSAKEIFQIIGDNDGSKKASSVEKEAREAKEYVEKKIGKES